MSIKTLSILVLIWANMLNSMQLAYKVVGFKQIIKTPLFTKISKSSQNFQQSRSIYEGIRYSDIDRKQQNLEWCLHYNNPYAIKKQMEIKHLKEHYNDKEIQLILLNANDLLNPELEKKGKDLYLNGRLNISDMSPKTCDSLAQIRSQIISKQCELLHLYIEEEELRHDFKNNPWIIK